MALSGRAAVLVIDDEAGIRDMLRFELGQEGFDVETAENGIVAVEAMKRRKFDLAVTDLKMPEMDGVTTVEALRALDPDIEIIVATGYASVETAVACMKRGAFDYLQKPYDLRELKLLLERAMQKSHLQGVLALYEASRALLATLHHTDLVRLVGELAQRVLRADASGLVLWNEEAEGYEVHSLHDAGLPAGLLHDFAGRVKSVATPLRVRQAELGGAVEGSSYGSALVYPLSTRDRPLGALVVFRRPDSPEFLASELQKGTVFASQLALSLDNARLYDELARQVAELCATRDQLVQAEKLALTGRLVGAFCHELNNPLAFILADLDALADVSRVIEEVWEAAKAGASYLQVCDSHACPRPGPGHHARCIIAASGDRARTDRLVREIGEIVGEIREGARRIASLVSGFSRLSGPPEAGPRERVEVATLLGECLEISQGSAGVPLPASLETQPAAGPFEAIACREDLRTAFLNLLAYLRKVTPEDQTEGGVSVAVRAESGRTVVVLSNRHLRLSAEERSRLFDPRISVDSESGRTMRLDLGMPLAYHLLSGNQAQVSVGSDGDGDHIRVVFAAIGT